MSDSRTFAKVVFLKPVLPLADVPHTIGVCNRFFFYLFILLIVIAINPNIFLVSLKSVA